MPTRTTDTERRMTDFEGSQADPFALVQLLLDVLSDVEGAILYRAPDGWRALIPTVPGSVLTLDDNLLPSWQPPTE